MTRYRIHPSRQPLDSILDPHRADGWPVDDENGVSPAPPVGVSCCDSLGELAEYAISTGMNIGQADQLVSLEGSERGATPDPEPRAVRVIATEYAVLGSALLFITEAREASSRRFDCRELWELTEKNWHSFSEEDDE